MLPYLARAELAKVLFKTATMLDKIGVRTDSRPEGIYLWDAYGVAHMLCFPLRHATGVPIAAKKLASQLGHLDQMAYFHAKHDSGLHVEIQHASANVRAALNFYHISVRENARPETIRTIARRLV